MALERNRNFGAVVAYALDVLSGNGVVRASQRELSRSIDISPTMCGRYLKGLVDPWTVGAGTMLALAKVARLEPSSLFAWIERGRDAAMEIEARLRSCSAYATSLELAEKLVRRLKEESHESKAEPDLESLRQRLAAERELLGPRFDLLLAGVDGAAAAVEALESGTFLEEADLVALERVLGS